MYELIYCDPPWQFSNKNTGGSMKSGAGNQYSTMTIAQMKQFDMDAIAAKDCVLVMWYVGAMPREAIELAEAWGFTIKNMNGFVWEKLTATGKKFFGMGFWTRAGSESAIIAVRGKPKPKSHAVRALHRAKVGRHSEKPDVFRKKCVELVGDVKRLEMFARQRANGWDAFGNEVEGSICIPFKSQEQAA